MSFTYSASQYLAYTTFKKCNDPKREEQKGRAKTAFAYFVNPSEHSKQDYITYDNILPGYGWCMQKHTGCQAIFLILWMIELV